MAARLLDGAAVAQAIRDEIRPRVEAFAARAGRPPGLGVVLVGDDPASQIYVRHKLKAMVGDWQASLFFDEMHEYLSVGIRQ